MEETSSPQIEYDDLYRYFQEEYEDRSPFDIFRDFLLCKDVTLIGRQVRNIAKGKSIDVDSDADVIITQNFFNRYFKENIKIPPRQVITRRKRKFVWSDMIVDCIIIPDESHYLIKEIVFSSLFSVEHAYFYIGELRLNEEWYKHHSFWMNEVLSQHTSITDGKRHFFNDRTGMINHALKMSRKGWKF